MMTADGTLKKDTVITCPKCGDGIAIVIRDIKRGEVVLLRKNFSFSPAQQPKEGEPPRCKNDDAGWAVQTGTGMTLHTSEGWQPHKVSP